MPSARGLKQGWVGSAHLKIGQGPPLLHPWWFGRSWGGEKPQKLWLGRGSMSWGQSLNPAGMGNGKWLPLVSVLMWKTALNGAIPGWVFWLVGWFVSLQGSTQFGSGLLGRHCLCSCSIYCNSWSCQSEHRLRGADTGSHCLQSMRNIMICT